MHSVDGIVKNLTCLYWAASSCMQAFTTWQAHHPALARKGHKGPVRYGETESEYALASMQCMLPNILLLGCSLVAQWLCWPPWVRVPDSHLYALRP